ncbi:hypothetical protein DL98DRAFT_642514 [Cadophora sp. DSE1049]|nr:hypothetical protein DL98DRAFT_642514 [Cadophora sp. DSE1049]
MCDRPTTGPWSEKEISWWSRRHGRWWLHPIIARLVNVLSNRYEEATPVHKSYHSLLLHLLTHHLLAFSIDLIQQDLLEDFQQKSYSPLSPATTSTSSAVVDMGSRTSRERVIASMWWRAKAQKMLTSATIGKVQVICSLLPLEDEKTAIKCLKARSDFNTLFALCCRDRGFSQEQCANHTSLSVDSKSYELWKKLRVPLEYIQSPWDWNWQPFLSRTAPEIAIELHAVVCRAVFRIPFLDFVKWAIGFDILLVRSLFNTVYDVCSSLRRAILDVPGRKGIYIKVEKILKSRHLKLAHWIVASSLANSPYPLEMALASILDPVKNLFATRNLDLVIRRLLVLDQRFQQIHQGYNWGEWSKDLDFWDCTYQALWSETPNILEVNPDILLEDMDERVRFLRSFVSVPKDEVCGPVGRILSIFKRLQDRGTWAVVGG